MAATMGPMENALWNATGLSSLFEGKRGPFFPEMGGTATLSNTVCISDASGEWLSVQETLVDELSDFGEIARLDTSLAMLLKCILVTYFDVRCAQQVLLQLAGRTEPFPPAAHDCRVVRVSMAAFAEKVGVLAGFHQFGEVMNISMLGGNAVVEFYDMRSAQYLLAAAGGCASPWTPEAAQQTTVAAASLASGFPALGMGYTAALAALTAQAHTQGSGAQVDAMLSQLSAAPFRGGPPPPELAKKEDRFVGNGTCGAKGSFPGAAEMTASAAEKAKAGAERASNRPVRTKVTTKEFSKYDIDAAKIQCGEDQRTTVMVRNLAGPRARKDFLSFLDKCGLHDKYTFFYMPCKEHRNVPAGFAFVNFAAPMDVLTLHIKLKSGLWNESMGDAPSKIPAMSYARFQGHDELAKHFSSSAVLHEQDPEKRPIFRQEEGVSKAVEYNQDGGTGGPIGSPKMPKVQEHHRITVPDKGDAALHATYEKRDQEINGKLMRMFLEAPSADSHGPAYIMTAGLRNATKVEGTGGYELKNQEASEHARDGRFLGGLPMGA